MKPETSVPVLRELPAERPAQVTQIQHRGNFMDLAEDVSEGVPEAIFPLPAGAGARPAGPGPMARQRRQPADRPGDRQPLLGDDLRRRPGADQRGIRLARGAAHPSRAARLAGDRAWSSNGWDLKQFVRLLVTSADLPAIVEGHARLGAPTRPGNQWLARGPRFRLPAETVRDQALAVAGLLSPEDVRAAGPPAAALHRPDSAAFGGGIDWQTSMGDDKYRRGLYTTWRRSNPYPSMATFDAPNREVCTVKRIRTNTPLQALVTLNDPVYVEAAQALARRIVAKAGRPPTERRAGSARASGSASRATPSDREIRTARPTPRRSPGMPGSPAIPTASPARWRPSPSARPRAGADLADLAAWTVVANVLS